MGLFANSFSIVKFKYSSSVSTCVAALKVLLNGVKRISAANSTQRMTGQGVACCAGGVSIV